jgi:pimeloyl-ACP methyl ester carboxylesterase
MSQAQRAGVRERHGSRLKHSCQASRAMPSELLRFGCLLAAYGCCIATPLLGQTRTLVSVGDHRLDVLRAGTGQPAVVLETGLADSLDTWAPLVPMIGRFTTAVAYSRAGFGRSESGTSDHSARAEAGELHVLLARLGLQPPYVLVGRSYGGLLVRLYTSLYPSEVAGLVLVDGTHEQQVQRFGTLDPRYPAQFRAFFDSVLASLPPGAQAAEIRETMRIQAAGTVEGLGPLPDIPLAVLTSMRSDPKAAYVNGTPAGHDVWRALHEEWVRRSTNAEHIVTTRSGHGIQADEPQLVIGAIQFVFERVASRPAVDHRGPPD